MDTGFLFLLVPGIILIVILYWFMAGRGRGTPG